MNLGNLSKKFLVFFASFALAFALGEIVVRWRNLVPPVGQLNIGHYQFSTDPLIRYEYKRNSVPETDIPKGNLKGFLKQMKSDSLASVSKDDYETFIRANKWDTFQTNSWGFRDDEFFLSKPADTVRIAVLGDSITAAQNVSQHNRFTELLATCLNNGGHSKKFEVMNFGVGGYNTLQEVATLRTKVLPFQPDIVLIAYCLNDNLPNSDGGIYQLLLKKIPSDSEKWINALRWNTQDRFCRFLGKSKMYVLAKYHWDNTFAKKKVESKSNGAATDIVRKAFSILSDIQAEHGLAVVIAVFPYFTNMSNYAYKDLHSEVEQKAGPYDFHVLDLFEDYFNNTAFNGEEFRTKKNDFCHPNEFGHNIAARAICKTLEQNYSSIIN